MLLDAKVDVNKPTRDSRSTALDILSSCPPKTMGFEAAKMLIDANAIMTVKVPDPTNPELKKYYLNVQYDFFFHFIFVLDHSGLKRKKI